MRYPFMIWDNDNDYEPMRRRRRRPRRDDPVSSIKKHIEDMELLQQFLEKNKKPEKKDDKKPEAFKLGVGATLFLLCTVGPVVGLMYMYTLLSFAFKIAELLPHAPH